MPEYVCELPLWGCERWELGLEPALLDDLADWQSFFDRRFDSMQGWHDTAAREEWAARATLLAARLRGALPDDVELSIDLWPLLGDHSPPES